LAASAALFLDFDGTLVPIAPRPQDVQLPGWVQPTLRSWSAELHGALALVSGRPLAQLDAFLAPLQFAAAGEHGAEWRGPTGQIKRHAAEPPAAIADAARALAAAHAGLLFEGKGNGFALHVRARPELESACGEVLAKALEAEPDAAAHWEWLHGHRVFELKQRAVSKGLAVRTLMAEPPFAGRQPVFVGDDLTDEAGIAEVQAAGGFGVRVGSGPSQARYRLADPAAVGAWLAVLPRAGRGR
jgi:trehalose 6-phosphate phosphatase